MSGEHGPFAWTLPVVIGSSPRERGALYAELAAAMKSGIIPA